MRELTITADCGGSNGVRVRLWKVALQNFADETGLTLHIHHYPPGRGHASRCARTPFVERFAAERRRMATAGASAGEVRDAHRHRIAGAPDRLVGVGIVGARDPITMNTPRRLPRERLPGLAALILGVSLSQTNL
jgi:hypothetical protein